MHTSFAGPVTTKTFLDIPAAAELAGLSIRHFRRAIEEERLPTVQIGRKFFILGKEFNKFMEAREVRNGSSKL